MKRDEVRSKQVRSSLITTAACLSCRSASILLAIKAALRPSIQGEGRCRRHDIVTLGRILGASVQVSQGRVQFTLEDAFLWC